MNKKSKNFGIAEVLKHIQDELIKSEEKRIESGRSRLFKTDKCEIELKCVIKKENVAKAGASLFKIVTITDDFKVSNEEVHTVKISFSTNYDRDTNENIENLKPEDANGLYPRTKY